MISVFGGALFRNAPRRDPPKGRFHKIHGAVIADTRAARRDVKPGKEQVEAMHTVQWPAGNGTGLMKARVGVAVYVYRTVQHS